MIPPIPKGFIQVLGYPHYCVNNDGKVISCRTRGGKFTPWKEMRQATGPHGRLYVGLRGTGERAKLRPIHLLVLEAFIGPRPERLEGCHNDGNHLNNHISNLRWDTHSANMADRTKHGRSPIGERNGSAKLTLEQVGEIRRLNKGGMQQKTIAPLFNVSKQCIQTVCSGKNWPDIAKMLPEPKKEAA